MFEKDFNLIEETEAADFPLCLMHEFSGTHPEGDLIIAVGIATAFILYGAAKSTVVLARAAKELIDFD